MMWLLMLIHLLTTWKPAPFCSQWWWKRSTAIQCCHCAGSRHNSLSFWHGGQSLSSRFVETGWKSAGWLAVSVTAQANHWAPISHRQETHYPSIGWMFLHIWRISRCFWDITRTDTSSHTHNWCLLYNSHISWLMISVCVSLFFILSFLLQ